MEISEIDSNYSYEEADFCSKLNDTKYTPIAQEELSSVDYKTNVLWAMFLGGYGANDFHAGNYEIGVAKIIGLGILTAYVKIIGVLFSVVSLAHLAEGNSKDSDGKIIRQVVQINKEDISSSDHKTTLLLANFLGIFGAHQFYNGKPFKGLAMLCTFGGLGIWTLVNLYQVATHDFRDGSGKVVCADYVKAQACQA